MKLLDRFTKIVRMAYERNHVNDGLCGETWIKDTVALLLRQHNAYVRIVKKEEMAYRELARLTVKDGGNPECWDMRIEACMDILGALHRYKKRKGNP